MMEFDKPRDFIFPKSKIITSPTEATDRLYIGVDPGVNFGVTLIHDGIAQVVYGKLPKQAAKGMYAVKAYNLMEEMLIEPYKQGVKGYAVVEGAAYDKRFGQVGLEEVRIGFFLPFIHMGYNVRILPPATVRKLAFGSAKKMAFDLWPNINHNGADSIGCALAAKEYKWE